MNCNNKENIKKLSEIYPKVFQKLHSIVGFDFESPFECYFLEGSFTVNKILKILEGNGYSYKDKIILLMHNPRTRNYQDLHMAGIERMRVRIDYEIRFYNSRLREFNSKGGFEDFRKMPHVETFIIVQHSESVNKPEKKEIDKYGRFKTAPVKTVSRYYGRDEYYTIDKSGYILDEKRQSLRNRVAKLRKDREKDAYLQKDNTGKIKELERMIDAYKVKIAEEIIVAQTWRDIETANKKLGYFGLEGIMQDFQRYKEEETNHQYNSIAESERAYQRIYDRLGAS